MRRIRQAVQSQGFRPVAGLRLLALALAAAVAMWPAASKADQVCSRSFARQADLLDEMRGNPDIQPLGERGTVAGFVDQGAMAVWLFTMPGHAAHPAVVCSRVVEQGEDLRMRTEASCHGSARDCNRLVAEFQSMNDRLRQRLMLRRAAW